MTTKNKTIAIKLDPPPDIRVEFTDFGKNNNKSSILNLCVRQNCLILEINTELDQRIKISTSSNIVLLDDNWEKA